MSMSFAALQIYDQYLTTYSSKRTSYNHIHDRKELRSIYGDIQRKSRFAPLYLNEPSPTDVAYAFQLKESAENLKQTITTFGSSDRKLLFSSKKAYSDTPDLADVAYSDNGDAASIPDNFHLKVKEFATPQVNTGSFLKANQMVVMPPGDYSFDISTNKLNYELQFSINNDETHEQLQNKLARLINHSDIGVHARVLTEQGRTALEITSDASGVPLQNEYHFKISDENTTRTSGVVHYLGLNKSIHNATNAVYTVNGSEHSSYSNNIAAYGCYQLSLNPDSTEKEAQIGLYPDMESLAYNIDTFTNRYNQFITGIQTTNHLLSNEMHKLLSQHKDSIEKYGMEIQDDNTINFLKDDSLEKMPELDDLQRFGSHVLRKLHSITLDPMEYAPRAICAYSNPATAYVNPYVTSIYSGMLFNSYC